MVEPRVRTFDGHFPAGGSTTRWRDGLGVHGEVYEEAIIWAFD